jgi:DnaK suppressor protein
MDDSQPADDQSRIESVLDAERADLEHSAERTRAERDDVRDGRADASADDEHDPEGSTLSSEWSRIEGIRRGLSARLEENMQAMARLTAGTYGLCTRCAGKIGAARLTARPSAGLCIDCARELER